MSDDGQQPDSQLPPDQPDPWPTLTAEWRVRVTSPTTGAVIADAPVGSEEEAADYVKRFHRTNWQVQRRMVTGWVPAGPLMGARVVVEPVEATDTPGEPGAQDCSYSGATPPGAPATQEG